MEIKKIKSLIKMMTYPEAQHYCDEHPKWKIPNLLEAQEINKEACAHMLFWISDTLHGRNLVYNKQNQYLRDNHPQFKNNVVLVESGKDR